MEIIRLPVGEQAPVDADCIRIERSEQAEFKLIASALCVNVDEGESVSVVNTPTFETFDKAEAAGLVWAANVGVEQLFISTGTLTPPLDLIEIDGPL